VDGILPCLATTKMSNQREARMRGLREIDRILRGEATSASNLREGGLLIHLGHVIVANILLAAFSGLCLGVYGVANRDEPEWRFMVADAFKVPLLFLLTLAITFPSLYVFNALVGSALGVAQIGRLMAAALTVLLAVLASFGPIVAFFSITSTSYPFILLLTVCTFTAAGAFAIHFLWRTLVKLTFPRFPPQRPTRSSESVEPPIARGPERVETDFPAALDWATVRVFGIWMLAFALVGTQMSWVLRPFIGAPDSEFAWFRPRQDSFFEAVAKTIRMLFS
jgi:hypothetical protein